MTNKVIKRLMAASALVLLHASPAYADYNCNVFIKHVPDNLTPIQGYNHDVPDFRTSGWAKFGYNAYARWLDFLPAGGIIAGSINNGETRWRKCMDDAMKRTFSGSSYNTIFDGIFSKQSLNAKVNFCMLPQAMERGAGGYMSRGLDFEFKAQKVTNRNKWGYETVMISPPKSYCAVYYEDECFAPKEVSEPDSVEPWDGESLMETTDELWESDPQAEAEAWEPGTNTQAPPPPPPPEYCEPKPFAEFDETPDEAWTEAGKSSLFPVDINGDNLSDIVLRNKDYHGQILRVKLSNGDGTFTPVDYRSGEKFLDTYGVLAGYFNDDDKTDLLLRDRVSGIGIVFHTKLSNGDGTFRSVRHEDGDEPLKRVRYAGPPMIGDVDGDRLSDVVLTYLPTTGGVDITVKFSNGDGTFRSTTMDTGQGFPKSARYHLADINKDRKSDLVVTYAQNYQLQIRSYLSNGDGTFEKKHYNSGVWFNGDKFQSFVADLNRDKRTDIVLLHRTPAGHLFANTYLGKGDGTFSNHTDHLSEDSTVDDFDAVVADVNGDQRSDIVLRRRDANSGLVIISKTSNGNGTFSSSEFLSGDGLAVDKAPIFVGNYDHGTHADLGLRYTHPSQGIKLRTKMGGWTTFTASPVEAGLGKFSYPLNPITGPMRWSGGGTFNPRRIFAGSIDDPLTLDDVVLEREIASGSVSGTLNPVSVKPGILAAEPATVLNPAEETEKVISREHLKGSTEKLISDERILIERDEKSVKPLKSGPKKGILKKRPLTKISE